VREGYPVVTTEAYPTPLASHSSSYGYVVPRALRSFPTRRSSDLLERARLAFGLGYADWLELEAALEAHRAQVARGFAQVFGAREDRKSTRLNSSHVKISYAVFCLKKKNAPNVSKHPITDANDGVI